MNEMMSEMREMMEKRMKKIVKKLGEKMGVSEDELMRMLEDTEWVSGRANGVESLVSVVEVKPVAEPIVMEEPVKKTRAPAKKKKEPELDENGEPVKKTRAPPKKKEPELDENGEPVKKTRAPAKKRAQGVETLVSMAEVPAEVMVEEKKVQNKRAKGVESLVSMMPAVMEDEIVVANVELEYVSDAETIKMPESESESEGNMLYNSKINVTRVVIKGIAYLYDENMNAYHEASKTFVGKYEPELGQISLLDMDSGSEEDASEDECPALSD